MTEEKITKNPTMDFRWSVDNVLQQKFLVVRHIQENYDGGMVMEGAVAEGYEWVDIPREGDVTSGRH